MRYYGFKVIKSFYVIFNTNKYFFKDHFPDVNGVQKFPHRLCILSKNDTNIKYKNMIYII